MVSISRGKINLNFWLPFFIIFIGLIIIYYSYANLILPILNSGMEFSYGDFSSIIGVYSGEIRENFTFYTFNDKLGIQATDTNRAFLLESISFLAKYTHISDSQAQSIIILISLSLGIYGLYRLTILFNEDKIFRSLLMVAISLFYFLNLWGVEKIGYVWIWVAYATFPLFLSFGLSYIFENKTYYIIIYSILFAFFGIIPHSFLYLLVLHFFLIIFCVYYRVNIKSFLSFSLIPMFLYSLLNLPVFFLMLGSGMSYPVPMSIDQLIMLSRYGELINIFTFSNNWWPQIPPEIISGNLVFRLSSLGILICFLLVSIISLKNNEKDTKVIVMLSLIFFCGLTFVAQGTNNHLFSEILNLVAKYHLLEVVAPFREWGRILILGPVLISLILIVSLPKLKAKDRYAILIGLILLVAINISYSPALIYLNKINSPTYVPQEYYELSKNISAMHKTLWINPSQADNTLGMWRTTWNTEKTPPKIEYSVGSTYPENFDLIRLMETKEPPAGLLSDLNVKYIIKRTDILGATNFKVNYDWLNCKNKYYRFLTLCENENGILAPFSVYTPTALLDAEYDSQKLYSVSSQSQAHLVPSVIDGRFTNFILLDDGLLSRIMEKLINTQKDFVITPIAFSYRADPEVTWSKASTSDLLHTAWHPYLETRGIENWQSDYNKGLVFTWAKDSLPISFNTNEDGNYEFFVRYFKNKDGKKIKIYIDDNPIKEITTKDQLNKFVWEKIGTIYFKKGRHKITLENIDGFNAVNIFTLIPSEEYGIMEKEIKETLQRKNIIYILESESDLYNQDARVLNKYDFNASNGEVLELNSNSKLWQDIDIVKSSNYRITARLNGSAAIKLDNKRFDVSANNLTWVDLDPVYLSEGRHSLEIRTNKSTDFDVIWVYSVDGNETLKNMIKEAPAQITEYTKIDPTLWKVQINATKPFMLSFAEPYDVLWEASVYQNGQLLEKVKPVPLYGTINGFWVNTTGRNLEIIVRYTQQVWFEIGLIIAAFTFIGCIGYLVYYWRKQYG